MIPEQTLWRAVVNQALSDASSNPPVDILDYPEWLTKRRKRIEAKGLEAESEIVEQASYYRYVRSCHATIDRWETDQASARKWLLRKSADFHDACRNAGYDPEYISLAAQRFKSQGWNVNPEAMAA